MLSVILPTYNEAANIVELIRALAIELSDTDHEIIVVDDDSPDQTGDLVEGERSRNSRLRLLRRVGAPPGLTQALREGFQASRGELVAWMDSDFSAPPATLPRLVRKVEEGYDLAVASRYVPGGSDGRTGSPLRRSSSRLITWLARTLLNGTFHDYTSGYVVVKRDALRRLPFRGDHGEYFIELVFRAIRADMRLIEVPYVLEPRRGGKSKTDDNFFRKGLKYLTTVGRLWLEKINLR